MSDTYYVTTTLPYVNADPHIGFALEIVQADTIARFEQLKGKDVVFNFGTDEHGQKIYQKAIENNEDPQEYVDRFAKQFDTLKTALNLSYTKFIRTTDPKHVKAAQKFWELCDNNGYIYKKNYKVKYCVGCELEKTDSELVDGKCELHPNREIEVREEENYFFKFSEFQDTLLDFYEKNPDFVVPDFRFNEIKQFVKDGLKDFSISRLKDKMPWGIEVPNDPQHVMYVWFDALINYISTIGWPEDLDQFNMYWPVIQFAGKDNLRQQSAIWQAMLIAAGLPNSKQIFIHGFINIDGQKISKSLGNVINPIEFTEKYGTDALRYYLLAKVHPFEDSDFTVEKFETVFNADLANGIGNLVSRVAKLCENSGLTFEKEEFEMDEHISKALGEYRFNDALSGIWDKIRKTDQYLSETKPWKVEETNELKEILSTCVSELRYIAVSLSPFMPETAEKISLHFDREKITAINDPLFQRIQ